MQVHDIPICFMNRGVKDLCEAIGTMNKSMESAEVKGGSLMRVKSFGGRVLTFVLWSYHLIGVKGVGEIWVSFKYKRIPNICYWCGCLNHFNKDCDLWIDSEGSLTVEDQEYGPWIRASPMYMFRNAVVRVSVSTRQL